MVAIMGPSGCGKTTLLNCLSGLDDFDQGEVYIDGTQLRTMSD
ncbi:MAG: ATP-binding cassette domain-containing protein, partial [Caldilinea sp.]|nr:ATP-binding cassette domain-containing protein [Caldilinea sp.]